MLSLIFGQDEILQSEQRWPVSPVDDPLHADHKTMRVDERHLILRPQLDASLFTVDLADPIAKDALCAATFSGVDSS